MQTSIDSDIHSPSVSTIGEEHKLTDATSREHSSLETRKDVSCRRRQFVDEKANFVQSNTSPRADSSGVYRLPTEVLSQIFLFCLPQDQHLLPKPGLAPVLLTMICRRWREVAIGFPKLWCTLQLQFDHDDWQQRALCYDSWLKRSRGCPLSLRIVCREGSKLRDVLEPYTHQISSLTLIFSHYDKPFMVDDFHALKELTILKDGFDLKRAIDQSLSKLPVNLRRLDLTRVLVRDRQLVHSTWARLTHIEIKIHELDEFPRLLSLCPNLTFLSMDDITDPIKIEIPEPVTHANLQHLHIHGSFFNDYDVGVGLFNAITLPNLGFVEFRQKGPWPHEEFKAFVTRSKCPLESLVFIMAMSLTDQQQEELTSLLPSLKRIAGKVYPKDIPIHSILNSILTA